MAPVNRGCHRGLQYWVLFIIVHGLVISILLTFEMLSVVMTAWWIDEIISIITMSEREVEPLP